MKFRVLAAVPAIIALSAVGIASPAWGRQRAPLSPPVPAGTCYLSVPANPLSARGLATPYVISGSPAVSGDPTGCTEPDPDTGIFVEAAIITPSGQPFEYDPLVITQGTTPLAKPVVPVIPAGSTVAIWTGADNINTQLEGPGASAWVNGYDGSNFGQMAYTASAPEFFKQADEAIEHHRLTVPALGKMADGETCPTINDYRVGDQDPNDNVPDLYLSAGGQVAQDTAVNRGAYPEAQVLANGSDNLLLDLFIDPALDSSGGHCTPWEVPSLDDPGSLEPTLAFDQIQSAYDAPGPFTTPLSDEMTLAGDGHDGSGTSTVDGVTYVGVHESTKKDNLYRVGVDQATNVNPSEKIYCDGLNADFPPFFSANQAAFAASPSPTAGENLADFLQARFIGTWNMVLPAPGIVPTCSQVTGLPDPEGN
jgi:hypothetical protein